METPPEIAPHNPTGGKSTVALSLGELVIAWNSAEIALRRLLSFIAFGNAGHNAHKAYILTAELGAVALEQALRSFANFSSDVEAAAAIKHAASFSERVREYRNYYVHGISGLGYGAAPDKSVPLGFIFYTSAKGHLKEHFQLVQASLLDDVANHCRTLGRYAMDLDATLRSRRTRGGAPLSPMPQMPPLPDRQVKPAHILQEQSL